jgi:hypothetical protein
MLNLCLRLCISVCYSFWINVWVSLQPRRIFTHLRTTSCPRADSLAHSLAGSSRFSGQQAANGRTHLPTASLDLPSPPDNRLPTGELITHSLAGSSLFSGQQTAHRRNHSATASPDLHASLDNRLPTGALTCPQPRRIFTLLRTTVCPGRTHSPTASSDLCATPDNQLPRTYRLQLQRFILRIFTYRLPRQPNASSWLPTTHCSWQLGPSPNGSSTTPVINSLPDHHLSSLLRRGVMWGHHNVNV